ncbi:MAG: glycosyltransferase family 39 protein [Sinobacteraceae bacterium]|nr:glycosyltransferase family 39 protein [Nevskiaceae bacterium]
MPLHTPTGGARPWEGQPPWQTLGWSVTIVAVLLGAYARLAGIGRPPLAEDEYYIVRAVEDILRTGLPAYDCGGFYIRGLLLQYSSAALASLGVALDTAPRLIAAISSLLTLPAAYLIARRSLGQLGSWLVLIVLAVSSWEVELGRFARMYAPFQAIFSWYVLYWLRYAVDRDQRALPGMVFLSVLSPLAWEGGVLVIASNILALVYARGREVFTQRGDWVFLFWNLPLLAAAYLLSTTDLRTYGSDPWPTGFDWNVWQAALTDPLRALGLPLQSALADPAHIAATLVVLSVLLWPALKWLLARRLPIAATTGLVLLCLAVACHQFVAAVVLLYAMLLFGILRPQDILDRAALPLVVPLFAIAAGWLLYGILTLDFSRLAGLSGTDRLVALIYPYALIPDFLNVIVRPWSWGAPVLGALLALVIVVLATLRALRPGEPDDQRALLALLLALLCAAALAEVPRAETRYVYFLYPVAIVLAAGFAVGTDTAPLRRALPWTLLAFVAGFLLSEDFQPQRLLRLTTPSVMFGEGVPEQARTHLVIRDDSPEVAAWLEANVQRDTDRVVNTVLGVDYYYPRFDRFFVEQTHPNFPQWTCRRGTIERWSNTPMLHTVAALTDYVAANPGRTLIVVPVYDIPSVIPQLAELAPRSLWSNAFVTVYSLSTTAGHRPAGDDGRSQEIAP